MSSGMKCANCNKGKMYGHKVSHAKNRTKRTFDPNLHSARITMNTAMKPSSARAPAGKRVRLCVKCLRTAKQLMKKSAPVKATITTA